MRHNKEITALAQKWANKLAADGRLSHSNASYKGKELGENVASKWSSVGADYTGIYRKLSICGFSSVLIIEVHLDWTNLFIFAGDGVTEQWYSESQKYDFRSPGFKQGISHIELC